MVKAFMCADLTRFEIRSKMEGQHQHESAFRQMTQKYAFMGLGDIFQDMATGDHVSSFPITNTNGWIGQVHHMLSKNVRFDSCLTVLSERRSREME